MKRGIAMFDDLEQQIKRDDDIVRTRGQRRLQTALVILLSLIVFGGVYAALRFLES
jgi:hypothetical protein